MNGKLVHSILNTKASTHENVKVFASNPWYDAVNGKIRNLQISPLGKNTKKCLVSPFYKSMWDLREKLFKIFPAILTRHDFFNHFWLFILL